MPAAHLGCWAKLESLVAVEVECRVAFLPWEILVQLDARGRLLYRDAGVALTSGGPVAVVGGPLDAGVSPGLLVTGLGSDTGCCGSVGCWDLTSWLAWLGDWESS